MRLVVGPRRHRDVRAEGETGGPELQLRILRGHEIDGGAVVVDLAAPFVPRAGAAADAAEVEAQHGAADAGQRLGRLKHDLGVHRAALRRQRMSEHDGGPGRSLGQIHQDFERPGWAGNFT